MARSVTVCIDTNVLLGFFNDEPDKVESCTAFFQLLFTRRIKSVVATITLLELAAILTAADHYSEAERVISSIESLPLFSIAEFRTDWVLRTAALKKANRLAIADAIIMSTAIESRCSFLITFDADFRSVGEISVLTPQKFLELHSI
ncbi:MAG: PIN domain-containing protein [Desulfuromonadales bacterium]|nr:PIN domain-containing protein [Desulfuromonadales bacterium]